MNKQNIFKKISLTFASVVMGLLISTATAHAIPYTGDTTQASPVPAFNVFTGDIPAPAPPGGEQNFFQGRVPVNGDLSDAHTQYVDPVSTTCTDGEVMQMRVYVHNGASAANNDNGNGPSVAHGTKVAVNLNNGSAKTAFNPSATISASNAASVSDGLSINCNGQKVELQYIKGSAEQYTLSNGFESLSDSVVTNGALIHSEKVPGDVWGCWQERVYVLLAVKVVKPTTPPPPAQSTATCDLFTITASEDRKVTVNHFNFTAVNANFKNVVVNWGDNHSDTFTDSNSVVGQTHQLPGSPDTFDISALVSFTANGKTLTSGGPGTVCSEQVSFTPNQPPNITPPPSTPPTTTVVSTPPSELVNTGAGSVVGLFAAATAGGAAIYRRILRRRFNQ